MVSTIIEAAIAPGNKDAPACAALARVAFLDTLNLDSMNV
jgi:hypothetical protein